MLSTTTKWSCIRGSTLPVLFAFCLALNAAHGASAQDIALVLTVQPPSHGAEVRFYATPSGTVSAASLGDAALVPSARTEHGYIVEIDSNSYRQDKNHRYVVDVYVALKSDEPNSALYKFIVWEDQAGKFSDTWTNVTAGISSHSFTDSTTIRLPLHCTDSDNLQIDAGKAIPISMGNDSSVTLGLKNALADLHVSIKTLNGVTVEDRNCPKCWTALTGDVPRSSLAPGASTTLDVNFQPNTMRILKQNFLPAPADAVPYQLVISVFSTAEKGGFDVSQEFYVPIRFTPAPRFLTLSLITGIIFGLVMRALVTRKLDWLDSLLQLLLAVVVWFVLVGARAKASMFGYDLDPTSLITAAIIMCVVAGGIPVGSKIAEALRKGKE